MSGQPLFFAPNRVWRCYTGGVLLNSFVGEPGEHDTHFPEDWLASTVRALNGEHSQGPDEGLARLAGGDGTPGEIFADLLNAHGRDTLGPDHYARYGANLAVLCKYLDSAVRLPIQCHPDVAMAKTLYGSDFGKTESWYVLATRRVGDSDPYLLMGFKPGVTSKAFAAAVAAQDIPALESFLHRIPVTAGQSFFVPGRLPHAIGPGVFMLEVQEPTDLVIQPERWCAGTRLSDGDMWGGLTEQQGLSVFDYTGQERAALLERVQPREREVLSAQEGSITELFGPTQTAAFLLWKAEIRSHMTVELPRPFGIVVVASGRGSIEWKNGRRPIERGTYFLQPGSLEGLEYRAEENMILLLAMPPEAT